MAVVFEYIWDKCPWYVKSFFLIVVVPNAVAAIVAFVVWFIPWHKTTTLAMILPYETRRDEQIKNIVERNAIQYKYTNDTLKRIEQHQAIMYQALLSRGEIKQ